MSALAIAQDSGYGPFVELLRAAERRNVPPRRIAAIRRARYLRATSMTHMSPRSSRQLKYRYWPSVAGGPAVTLPRFPDEANNLPFAAVFERRRPDAVRVFVTCDEIDPFAVGRPPCPPA